MVLVNMLDIKTIVIVLKELSMEGFKKDSWCKSFQSLHELRGKFDDQKNNGEYFDGSVIGGISQIVENVAEPLKQTNIISVEEIQVDSNSDKDCEEYVTVILK